jgi:hypothetical protein
MKAFIIKAQEDIKKFKANPLNPDNVRKERIKDLLSERDKYRDLYVSESIKNKEGQNNIYDGTGTH